MESILERAARVLARHPAPALPLDELRRLVGDSGVGVSEEVLLRALRRGAGRFRLVDPRLGPLRTPEPFRDLRPSAAPAGTASGPGSSPDPGTPVERRRRSGGRGEGAPRPPAAAARARARAARCARGSGPRPERGGRGAGPLAGLDRPWVVARPSGQGADGPDGLRRLRQSVAHLGWAVDEGSPREMARWCGLLHEERRLRRSARCEAGPGEADVRRADR